MSEEPQRKKKKKPTVPQGLKPSTVSERLRRAELKKTLEALPIEAQSRLPPRPKSEIVPTLSPAAPAAPAPPAPVPEPRRDPDQEMYDRIFEELEARRTTVAPAEPGVVEQAEAPLPSELPPEEEVPEGFEETGELPLLGRRVSRVPLLTGELSQDEFEAYRRFERLNSDQLGGSLRALAHEEAILSGSRIDDERFAAYYGKHHSHALPKIEDYYYAKLKSGGTTISAVIDSLSVIAGGRSFNPFEIDHVLRHLMGRWVQERRANSYERRGLIGRAAELIDIFSGVSDREAGRQRRRNDRLTEGRK